MPLAVAREEVGIPSAIALDSRFPKAERGCARPRSRATVDSEGSGRLSMVEVRRPHATLRAAEPDDAPRQHRLVVGRLLLGSATMLFLELALIRWLGANV